MLAVATEEEEVPILWDENKEEVVAGHFACCKHKAWVTMTHVVPSPVRPLLFHVTCLPTRSVLFPEAYRCPVVTVLRCMECMELGCGDYILLDLDRPPTVTVIIPVEKEGITDLSVYFSASS